MLVIIKCFPLDCTWYERYKFSYISEKINSYSYEQFDIKFLITDAVFLKLKTTDTSMDVFYTGEYIIILKNTRLNKTVMPKM